MSISQADGSPPMTERAMRIDHLKTSIERDEYDVDPKAVAEAILALLARRHQECS
jgi:anti-sigma28 factor (negative regulator of flagellin synthesis)